MDMEFNTDDNNIRFIVESALTKLEKANIRWCIVCILLVIALIGSNLGWLYYESQWAYVQSSTEVEQSLESSGDAIINDGVHINGKDYSESKTND